jgi:TRAP-type transport system periplasmic protein
MRTLDVRKVLVVLLLVTILLAGSLAVGCKSTSPSTTASVPSTSAPSVPLTSSAATTAAVKPIEIKISTHFPTVHPTTTELFAPFIEKVATATEGRVTAKLYPAGQLGKETEEYDMVLKGTCEAALIVPTYYAGRFPLEDVFQVPFLVPGGANSDLGRKVRDTVYTKYLIPNQFKDMKVLWTARFEPNVLHMLKKPVRTVNDLKGLMIGYPGGSLPAEYLTAFGASPQQIMAPDMYTSLERGMVDGQLMPLEVELGFKLIDLSKYITSLNMAAGTAFIGLRMETWNSISPKDQKAIDDICANWAEDQNGKILEGITMAATGACKGKGIEFIDFSATDMAKLVELAKPVQAAWINKMAAQGFPAQAMVNDIQAMVASK